MSMMMMTVVVAAWASTHYTVMIVKQVQKVRESATAAMELMEENTFITMCIIIGLEREREKRKQSCRVVEYIVSIFIKHCYYYYCYLLEWSARFLRGEKVEGRMEWTMRKRRKAKEKQYHFLFSPAVCMVYVPT